MADPIPAADPALLAAQAKAGQAGVDAYKAARNQLAAQRQQAVQQAMQEAALRGSPAGAMGSIQSTITSPYDQGIAAMTQGSAAFQADMAARDRRMADYNAAVGAARSYIPQQVELAVGPIRAQGEANARLEEIRGQQTVAGIQADTQLQIAKMNAALQAAQIKAKQAKAAEMKLNQGELEALMSAGATDILSGQVNPIEQILGANMGAMDRAVIGAAKKVYPHVETPSDVAARNQSYWDRMGAAYTAAGIQEDQAKHVIAARAATPAQQSQRQTPPSSDWDIVPRAAPSTEGNIGGGAGVIGGIGGGLGPIGGGGDRYAAARAQIAQLSQHAVSTGYDPSRTIMPQEYLARVIAGMSQAYKNLSTPDAASGNRIFMTPGEIKTLSPDQAALLHAAAGEGTINDLGAFQQLAEGAPGNLNQGYPGQAATTAVKDAMVESARRLQAQGYNIDLPQVMNALPKEGTSLYNLLAQQRGGRTSQSEYDYQSKQAGKEQAAGTKQEESSAKEAITRLAGRALPSNLGSNVAAYNAMYGAGADEFAKVDQRLKEIINSHKGDDKPPTTQQLVAELEDNGVTDQYLISLALFMNRRM